jgi:N-acyl amino acid synthase of PEP-CTERM/exosortase system
MLDMATHAQTAIHSFPVSSSAFDNEEDTLLKRYRTHFEAVTADTPERVQLAQRVRYQVYCIENPLEKRADNPDGVEADEFDSHAAHTILFDRDTGSPLGTVRLILPLPHAPERSFAVQRLLDPESLKVLCSLPLHTTAEISRFSISRQSRRRIVDGVAQERPDIVVATSGPLMRLGLMQGIMRMSVEHGVTDWCALMEPTLLRMLAAMAIRFRPIGPLVEFRGRRQPCCLNVRDMLKATAWERPRFWELITDGGSLGDYTGAA